jgi:hypothetical protein
MSLVSLITELESITIPNLSDLIPTRKNCERFYPDMFNDPEISTAAKRDEQNVSGPLVSDDVQRKMEERENASTDALALSETADTMPNSPYADFKHGEPSGSPYTVN